MLLKKLIEKKSAYQEKIESESNKSDTEICEDCGHDFGAHLLKGSGHPTTQGWIECPVSGCQCHKTWNLSVKSKSDFKQARAS